MIGGILFCPVSLYVKTSYFPKYEIFFTLLHIIFKISILCEITNPNN